MNIPEGKYWVVVLATRGQTDILKNHAESISSQKAGTCLPQTFCGISRPLLDRARQDLDPAHRPYVSSDLVEATYSPGHSTSCSQHCYSSVSGRVDSPQSGSSSPRELSRTSSAYGLCHSLVPAGSNILCTHGINRFSQEE